MSTGDTGLQAAYLLDGKGGAKKLDWTGLRAWTPAHGKQRQLHHYKATDLAAWLPKDSKIDPLMREALVEEDPRPRAVVHGDDLFVIVRGINMNQDATPEDMISVRCFVETLRVITMRHRLSRSLK